jgi:ribosomal protein S27AE
MPYHKVPLTERRCANPKCHKVFFAAHKSRLYCTSSCNTQACELRKAAKKAAQPHADATADVAASSGVALAGSATTPQSSAPTPVNTAQTGVTLAPNLTNLALLTGASHAPAILSRVLNFVGKLLAPPAAAGPSTWLPLALRQVQAPRVLVENPDWEEPRLFVCFEYEGQTFLYRDRHELLFVQEPTGTLQQVRTLADFTALTSAPSLTIAQIVNQYVPGFVAAEQALEQAPPDPLLTP